jgi:hypothetical protein
MQHRCAVAGHGVCRSFVNEAGAKQSGALEVLWKVGLEHVSPVRSFVSFRGQWPKPPMPGGAASQGDAVLESSYG